MKIVFILPGLHMSGGVISTIELANNLKDRGHDAYIIYPKLIIGPRLKWYNFRSIINTIRTTQQSKSLIYKRITPICPILEVPWLQEKFIPDADAVIATWWETAYYIQSYSNRKGAKYYFVRGYEVWYGNQKLVNQTYLFPFKIIVTSTALKKTLQDKVGVTPDAIIPNGINFKLFYRINQNHKTNKKKRIGMVYRGMELKGMQDGFHAYELTKQSISDISLVLFGQPPVGAVPEGTEFHEYPDIDQLRIIYNSLDVFMLPSHHGEAFANPPLEAMACGTACVLTNVGGVPDYAIPGKTALVSEPKDPEALASNLSVLLRNDELRETIGESGHRHVQQFSWSESARRLENFLGKQIEGCPK